MSSERLVFANESEAIVQSFKPFGSHHFSLSNMTAQVKYVVDLVCESSKCGAIMEILLKSGEPLCSDYMCPQCGCYIDATRAVSNFDLIQDEFEILN